MATTAPPTDTAAQAHRAPAYLLTLGGRDITHNLAGFVMSLTLAETRGDEADQLDIELDDSSGRLALPPKGEKLALQLGWQGRPLVDKGEFVIDEVEHRGAPDVLCIRARSADLRGELRTRREASYHGQTLGAIVTAIARRHGLAPRVDPALAGIPVGHIDQGNESDLHFLTRLGRHHDATATVKKGALVFARINARATTSGQPLPAVRIERADGDQHRWHAAERDTYTGVRAEWQDTAGARKRGVVAGDDRRTKRLRDTYGSEPDARAAARAELQRLQRGAATLELQLAHARPDIAPQSAATVQGWRKPEIDAAAWIVKTATHSLDASSGFTTRLELETQGRDASAQPEPQDQE